MLPTAAVVRQASVVLSVLGCLGAAACQQPALLRVALYPYVPDGRGLFQELEAAFEASHPGVNLELVETFREPISGELTPLSRSYYSGGLLSAEADVYEIDTVLLDDMVHAGKLTALGSVTDRFVEGALAASSVDGSIWAIPHWVCGNFLYYAADDHEIREAATWDALLEVLDHGAGGLLIDLSASTLGEWYITALAAGGAGRQEILRDLAAPALDEEVVSLLAETLDSCPAGSCRSDTYHDRVGYYARRFARGQARAYVGYSEMVHFALSEIANDCGLDDACLSAESIAVRALPRAQGGTAAVGWVDGLAVAADLPRERERLAREFISFLTSWDGYHLVLDAEWPDAPRYLMPAVRFSSDELAALAPLYPAFFGAYQDRLFLTGDGIDEVLRAKAQLLDCALPSGRLCDDLAQDVDLPGDLRR